MLIPFMFQDEFQPPFLKSIHFKKVFISCLEVWVEGFGLRILNLRFWGLGFGVWGVGCGVSGLGFMV